MHARTRARALRTLRTMRARTHKHLCTRPCIHTSTRAPTHPQPSPQVCQLQAELNAARGELGETKLALATELQRNADYLSLLTSGSTGISASQEATAIAAASAASYLTKRG